MYSKLMHVQWVHSVQLSIY